MRLTKTLAFATACLAAASLVSAAQAADNLPLASRFQAPAPVAQNWNDWYVGATLGRHSSMFDEMPATGLPQLSPSGWMVGAVFGVNRRFGWGVLGLETDLSMLTGDSKRIFPAFPFTETQSAKLSMLGTTALRFGVPIWNDQLLPYVRGGVAYGKASLTDSVTFGGTTLNASSSAFGVGYTIGGGLDWKINDRWTWMVIDYRYVSLTFDAFNSPVASGSDKLHANIFETGLKFSFN